MKRCPASDTGAPTLADTDTVWAEGVPAIQQPIKINQNKSINTPKIPSQVAPVIRHSGNAQEHNDTGYKESDFQAELHICSFSHIYSSPTEFQTINTH